MYDTSDFLDELVAKGMTETPEFPAHIDVGVRRGELLRSFGRRREALGISHRSLASRMHVQQPAIARLEHGECDPKASTLERYAAALGFDVDILLVPRQTMSCRVADGIGDQKASEGLSVASQPR